MEDMNFKTKPETDNKKPKTFWRNFGIFLLAFMLAILTVVVIYNTSL